MTDFVYIDAGDNDGFTDVSLPSYFSQEFREKLAREHEAHAAWYRAGACDTCITGSSMPLFLGGKDSICMQYSGANPQTWVQRWLELPPEKRPYRGTSWGFLRDVERKREPTGED